MVSFPYNVHLHSSAFAVTVVLSLAMVYKLEGVPSFKERVTSVGLIR